ncbi:class I SAM-dependent methyltransferase [Patescibacteria group bacterium]|nr:MAG: class I SAM-dependent methyltransferase [Patescibacteria group bacterium]
MPTDFGSYARRYDNRKDFDRVLLAYKFDKLAELRPRFGTTLELGCAMGLMTRLLVPRAHRLDVVDASEEYIRSVRRLLARVAPRRKGHVRYYASLFQDFQPDRRYDTIVLSGVLPALPRPVAFLRRASAWLTRGGVIYITSHNAYSLHRRIGKAMGLIRDEHALSQRDVALFGHRKVYDFDSLQRDVRAAGLGIRAAGGLFLKPFPNGRMERLPAEMVAAFGSVGTQLDPRLAAELYVLAGRRR